VGSGTQKPAIGLLYETVQDRT